MPRFRRSFVALFAALTASLTIVVASSQAVDPSDTISVDQTFNTTGEHFFTPDAGVKFIDVTLSGGSGGSTASLFSILTATGGRGALVESRVGVPESQPLFVYVGGIANGRFGGFNGGGTSGTVQLDGNPGGGGGGASDIRTIVGHSTAGLESRLVVAAGGGGAGKPANGSTTATGGNGGDRGAGGGAGGPSSAGGGGGGAGTLVAGGPAGLKGGPGSGNDGTAGSFGQGGNGGADISASPTGGGGSGGGGVYGGGGGGSGDNSPVEGGGGGGGGASLDPDGSPPGTVPRGEQPRVEIHYTVPDTGITGPPALTNDNTPSFTVESSESGSSFKCRLNNGSFEICNPSGFTLGPLPEGSHTVEAFATNEMGNYDATPASITFVVDTTPPVTTISGPSSTSDTTPTFTYSSEPGSTFQCALDADPLASCPESGFTAPAPLAPGPHTFRVQATDPAGNVETTPATREFNVVEPTTPPVTTTPPTSGTGDVAPTTAKCGGKAATIVGTPGSDELKGTPGPDVIAGLGGADEIKGGKGKDLLCGGPGKDKLIGGKGMDKLIGGKGMDKLIGGKGNDRCVGGKGKDSGKGCEKEKAL